MTLPSESSSNSISGMKEVVAPPLRFFPEDPFFFSLKPVNLSGSIVYMVNSGFSFGCTGCYCGVLKSLANFRPLSQSSAVMMSD
jgi:hypothetical protein